MKRMTLFFFLFFFFHAAYSQNDQPHKKFFRLSADNDALVPTNNATDWGYTSGIRIDFFYSPVKDGQNLFNWFNRFAGTNRVNTSGWGLMQMIIAPQKTSLAIPDKNDYPYSGALFAIHTIHSANPVKRISFRSEWVVGVMGPPSLAKQTHTFFHQIIKDPAPMGWDYQLPADLLLNYNIKVEKQLTGNRNIGLFANGEISSGTMNDAISPGLRLQFGNNKDYLSGMTRQYFAEKRSQLSFSIQTSADLILYNALLQGGLFNSSSPVHDKNSKSGTTRKLNNLTGSLEFSLLFSLKKFAVSFDQKFRSSELKDYGGHSTGNISVYKTL